MSYDEWEIPRFSKEATALLDDMHRHGGSMRILPLFRRSGLAEEAFLMALAELHARRWVHVCRRNPRTTLPPGLPERLRGVDRIVLSRFGRWRYSVTRHWA